MKKYIYTFAQPSGSVQVVTFTDSYQEEDADEKFARYIWSRGYGEIPFSRFEYVDLKVGKVLPPIRFVQYD